MFRPKRVWRAVIDLRGACGEAVHRTSATTGATLGCCALAIVALLIWLEWNAADAWMPNVATLALGVAATITVVEWIIRREERLRYEPWRERVLYWLGLDVRMFTDALLLDYAETHIDNYRPIPDDVLVMLDQWTADHAGEDHPRGDLEHLGRHGPLILLEAENLAERLDRIRTRDLSVLEPDLVRALDDFLWAAGQGSLLATFQREPGAERARHLHTAAGTVVAHFDRFARVFFSYGDTDWRRILELTRRANDEYHAGKVRDVRAAESATDQESPSSRR